jgi:hypothetical protein
MQTASLLETVYRSLSHDTRTEKKQPEIGADIGLNSGCIFSGYLGKILFINLT